jgi:hypothetical protein
MTPNYERQMRRNEIVHVLSACKVLENLVVWPNQPQGLDPMVEELRQRIGPLFKLGQECGNHVAKLVFWLRLRLGFEVQEVAIFEIVLWALLNDVCLAYWSIGREVGVVFEIGDGVDGVFDALHWCVLGGGVGHDGRCCGKKMLEECMDVGMWKRKHGSRAQMR